MDEKSVCLADEGLPHLRMRESGEIYNPLTGFVYKSTGNNIQIFTDDPNIKGYVYLHIPAIRTKYFGIPELDCIPETDKCNLGFLNCPKYCITRDGRLFSYVHYRFLKPCIDHKGYLRAAMYDKGFNVRKYRIHRLVALAFIPNPENKEQVNHIDGNKLNNDASNLEWVTNNENKQHAVEHRLYKHAYTDEEVKQVCELLQQGVKEDDVVKLTGVTKSVVSYIRCGGYRHISYAYDFGTSRRGKTWAARQQCCDA